MRYTYKPKGVCAAEISFDIEDGIIKNVKFLGGCQGNPTGVAKLCEGRNAKEVMKICEGIMCGYKGTSCPDQLAKAIRNAVE